MWMRVLGEEAQTFWRKLLRHEKQESVGTKKEGQTERQTD
jgi:hypothetical protein